MAAAFVSGGRGAGPVDKVAAIQSKSVKAAVPVKAGRIAMMAEMSKSIPFLEKPKNLDGSMAGDVGFDPLGFSDKWDVKFLREAELKHGRICMLAALGFIYPEIMGGKSIPSPEGYFTELNPLKAVKAIPTAGLLQIVLFVMVLEAISWNKVFMDKTSAPGDFKFDPLGLKSPKMELSEVKNGRLAMIAVGGMIHQVLLTKQPILAQLKNGPYLPKESMFPIW
uniref:Light-harvesting complex I polypeptide n=1 Tax=Porphyridium purpureum TaxID=35688 RepID=P93449_PORPP|nr:light-harvesting complex I polypeptide [Porphyridium cruentum]